MLLPSHFFKYGKVLKRLVINMTMDHGDAAIRRHHELLTHCHDSNKHGLHNSNGNIRLSNRRKTPNIMTQSCGPIPMDTNPTTNNNKDFTGSSGLTPSQSVYSFKDAPPSLPSMLLQCGAYRSTHYHRPPNDLDSPSDSPGSLRAKSELPLSPSLASVADQLKFMDESSSSSPATTPGTEDPKTLTNGVGSHNSHFNQAVRRCRSQENTCSKQLVCYLAQSEDDLAASCDPLGPSLNDRASNDRVNPAVYLKQHLQHQHNYTTTHNPSPAVTNVRTNTNYSRSYSHASYGYSSGYQSPPNGQASSTKFPSEYRGHPKANSLASNKSSSSYNGASTQNFTRSDNKTVPSYSPLANTLSSDDIMTQSMYSPSTKEHKSDNQMSKSAYYPITNTSALTNHMSKSGYSPSANTFTSANHMTAADYSPANHSAPLIHRTRQPPSNLPIGHTTLPIMDDYSPDYWAHPEYLLNSPETDLIDDVMQAYDTEYDLNVEPPHAPTQSPSSPPSYNGGNNHLYPSSPLTNRLRGGNNTNDCCSDTESIAESVYHQPPKAADRNAAYRLAKRLYNLEGFKNTDVAKHLSKRNDFSQLVGEEYVSFFDFTSLKLDVALRTFLLKISLAGETSDRERVLHHFSRRFIHCNPDFFASEDACHTLVCALMLLNTDLHGQNVTRKMSCQDFIVNLSELNNGEDFPRDELKYLYNAIKQEPISFPQDEEVSSTAKAVIPDQAKRLLSANMNPFIDIPSSGNSKEYMRGFLMKKWVMESHGRKTALGKRSWKMYFGRLRDLLLSLHKDAESAADAARADDAQAAHSAALAAQSLIQAQQKTLHTNDHDVPPMNGGPTQLPPPPPAPQPGPMPEAVICVHHSYTSRADDYSKKQNVLRLKTKDGAQFLFQVSDTKEVDHWVDSLNFVAALLSAPAMAGGVGSEKSFYRPLLPSSYTRLNIREQLDEHQRSILCLSRDLVEHQKSTPKKGDKGRIRAEYEEKGKYLSEEIIRYKTYARLLEAEILHLQAAFLPNQPTLVILRDPPLMNQSDDSKQRYPNVYNQSDDGKQNQQRYRYPAPGGPLIVYTSSPQQHHSLLYHSKQLVNPSVPQKAQTLQFPIGGINNSTSSPVVKTGTIGNAPGHVTRNDPQRAFYEIV